MTTLALWLLPVAALACWRWSRLVSGALGAALGAWFAYRYVHAWEPFRWVSAVTGLAGAFELGLHGKWPLHVIRNGQPAKQVGFVAGIFHFRYTTLALLLVGSAAADAAAMLWWRGTGEWGPQPFFQVVVLVAMIAVGLWPRRRT